MTDDFLMKVVTAGLVAVIFLAGWWSWSRTKKTASGRALWPNQEWPPISEDEFIRRCSPGVDRERALRVRKIISTQWGIDYDRIYPEQNFVDDLGCD